MIERETSCAWENLESNGPGICVCGKRGPGVWVHLSGTG